MRQPTQKIQQNSKLGNVRKELTWNLKVTLPHHHLLPLRSRRAILPVGPEVHEPGLWVKADASSALKLWVSELLALSNVSGEYIYICVCIHTRICVHIYIYIKIYTYISG